MDFSLFMLAKAKINSPVFFITPFLDTRRFYLWKSFLWTHYDWKRKRNQHLSIKGKEKCKLCNMFMITAQFILTSLFLAVLADEKGKFFNFYQMYYGIYFDIITWVIKNVEIYWIATFLRLINYKKVILKSYFTSWL